MLKTHVQVFWSGFAVFALRSAESLRIWINHQEICRKAPNVLIGCCTCEMQQARPETEFQTDFYLKIPKA